MVRFSLITERSTVQLTSFAFNDPSRYLDKQETESDVFAYVNYFTRKTFSNPGFKASYNIINKRFTPELCCIHFSIELFIDITKEHIRSQILTTHVSTFHRLLNNYGCRMQSRKCLPFRST